MRVDLLSKLDALEKRLKAREVELMEWRRWYAWRPVFVEGVLVWLEWLERRSIIEYTGTIEGWPTSEYRFPESNK